MNIENIVAREQSHVFIIYSYLIRHRLTLLPFYFYKTSLAKQSYIDIFKFLEKKGIGIHIFQQSLSEKDFEYPMCDFLSLLRKDGRHVLCHVQYDSHGVLHVVTGYDQRELLTPEQAVNQLQPIKITFYAKPDNQEFLIFQDWLIGFCKDAEYYKAHHIFTVENALPVDMCEYLVNYLSEKKQRSLILNNKGLRIESAKRTSSEIHLDNAYLMERTHQISSRLLGSKTSYILEKPLLVTYSPGQQYRPHFDTTEDYSVRRRRTVILYLNDGFTGGETDFVVLGMKILPKKGMALVFDNIISDQTTLFSMHAGLPVISGYKYICNVWTD